MTTLSQPTLFDEAVEPREPGPKTLRELLFAHLLTALEEEAEREWPQYDEAEYRCDPDGVARSGSSYWQSWYTAQGIRTAAGRVRSALRTHEEYLVFDRANSRSTPPSDTELACARHRDACTVCMSHALVVRRMERDHRPVAEAREILVQGIHEVLAVIAADKDRVKLGEQPAVTVALLEKALKRINESAFRRWQQHGGGS